ncbi:hypothetical protein CANCADRAFT_2860 [Tortispora caseinolytica NRRL Y-17796]|uniref:NADH-ubiquinone oxidoreductase 78 kDa subunit, mitochondrial n=1 Tax=Tortispora caseinolytica NRRL Y-17796 TaxID=767744 RepID=A0A1E4THB3_9ASCO|nr:hypothetical protein CANCADRAFT_2860 [Tortispora caseinolytica NRRL Y-17796]
MLFRRVKSTNKSLIPSSRQFSRTVQRNAEVELTIDGKKVSIEAGSALIQACEKAGVTIPRYCYHEKLAIAGNCRMCLVDLERAPKVIPSCAFPVAPGMVVRTDTERVRKAREGVTEMLLANHPLDCPVCDQGGECDLQDQSLRYGSDRGRFSEIVGKRAVEDKNIGPLIKTSMNRCIHCTRCVRFSNDVAGAPEFGTSGRGNDMQIGTYLERNLDSELSGNVIDLCPVGALTSKPYAFTARPWELKKVESVDVMDGIGSSIRVDAKGNQVVRILPRANDAINEEWISDKTRFCYDGLKTQRLTTPLVKEGSQFVSATWEEALSVIADKFKTLNPKENEVKAVAGDLVEVEALVALKDLVNRLGSENLALDAPNGSLPPSVGIDFRSNYIFNSTITGVEDADTILVVGSNPRHEAAVLNARIRKQWLRTEDMQIGFVGASFDSTWGYTDLGDSLKDLQAALSGEFGKRLASSKKPMIIVGSGVTDRSDAGAYLDAISKFVSKTPSLLNPKWNGFNVLQRTASRTGAYDVGFVPATPELAAVKPKILYLLGADEISAADIPKDAFVIYQGHHGDIGAQYADVILPAAAYTEKAVTYVNTEGRAQVTRAAVGPPGAAREDWKIIRAVSEFLGVPLEYDDIYGLRERVAQIAPHAVRADTIQTTSADVAKLGLKSLTDKFKGAKASNEPLKQVVGNFYFTNSVTRSSTTMARCSTQFTRDRVSSDADSEPEKAFA